MVKIVYDEQTYDRVVNSGILRAQCSIWIATANVKNAMIETSPGIAESIVYVLADKVAAGLEVRLLHSGVPSGSFLSAMSERRDMVTSPLFGMRKCIRAHFKCVLLDSAMLYIGSANLTGAGLGMKSPRRRNFEMGIITDEDLMMDRTAAYFDNIWSGTRCKDCGRKKECIVPLEEPE